MQSRKASPPSDPGSVFSVWRYECRCSLHLMQVLFHASIINAQKLRGTGNRINIEMLSFGSLFVHETEDGIFRVSAAQEHAANLKQRSTQGRRPTLGDMTGLGLKVAGLKGWSIHSGKGNLRTLMRVTPHITDFRHQLRPCHLARSFHCHDNRVFRQQGGKSLHFLANDLK